MKRKLLTMLSVCLLLILASLAVAEESVSSLSTLCDAQECACLKFQPLKKSYFTLVSCASMWSDLYTPVDWSF